MSTLLITIPYTTNTDQVSNPRMSPERPKLRSSPRVTIPPYNGTNNTARENVLLAYGEITDKTTSCFKFIIYHEGTFGSADTALCISSLALNGSE